MSWLNLSRSLSQLPVKEDNRRRCSDRLSEPARVEACGCAGMLMPCEGAAAGDRSEESGCLGDMASQTTVPVSPRCPWRAYPKLCGPSFLALGAPMPVLS